MKPTKAKAREILEDKMIKGKPITEKQRKFFGAVSSGSLKKNLMSRMHK